MKKLNLTFQFENRLSLTVAPWYQSEQGVLQEPVVRDVRNVADLYLARLERNYASSGEAFAQDETIKGDMLICRRLAEMAVAYVSELEE